MTSPSDPVPPTDDAAPTRSDPSAAAPGGDLSLAFLRAPILAIRKRARRPAGRIRAARPNLASAAASGLFRPGEIEFARLHSLPPFDTDLFILTDRRLLRVRTDAAGTVSQLSQTALRQVEHARAEDFRDRSTVTVELRVGSSMRLEETASAQAQRFVTTINEVAERSRS